MPLFLLTVHVMICVALVVLVLLQHGKGADAGAHLSGSASSTVFGSQGPTGFLVKLTVMMAIAFFATCFMLSYSVKHDATHRLVETLRKP